MGKCLLTLAHKIGMHSFWSNCGNSKPSFKWCCSNRDCSIHTERGLPNSCITKQMSLLFYSQKLVHFRKFGLFLACLWRYGQQIYRHGLDINRTPIWRKAFILSLFVYFDLYGCSQLSPPLKKRSTHMSFLMGSCVVGVAFLFLSTLRCDRPFLSRRNDSLSDFLNDFRRDIGLSSAFAMSANVNVGVVSKQRRNLRARHLCCVHTMAYCAT